MGTEAEVEPRPGGLYLVNVTGARFARGSFREVVPVHRLAYSFGWDGSEVVPPGSSLVEIDLIEQPDGTLLRLTHSGLPSAEQCAGHAEGWARSEAHTSELQSLMRISYAVFCLKKKKVHDYNHNTQTITPQQKE